MRNGNIFRLYDEGFTYEFLPYLWGMETSDRVLNSSTPKYRFLPYLWGMETKDWKKERQKGIGFLPYLWGMETCFKGESTRCIDVFLPYLWGMETFLATYSIPKWFRFLPYLWGMETNDAHAKRLCTHSSYRTYEEWKQYLNDTIRKRKWVLTVPMRNGNLVQVDYNCQFAWVLTVPMRNGNAWSSSASCSSSFSSYRTYEEWKLL